MFVLDKLYLGETSEFSVLDEIKTRADVNWVSFVCVCVSSLSGVGWIWRGSLMSKSTAPLPMTSARSGR